MLNVGSDREIVLRMKSTPSLRTIQREWLNCPRCKCFSMTPTNIGKGNNGTNLIWWLCKNYKECKFPLDMPSKIFHVEQTKRQEKDGYFPLPNILKLPDKYKYLYPLTFSSEIRSRNTRVDINCDSNRSTTSNDLSDSASESVESSSDGTAKLNSKTVQVEKDLTSNCESVIPSTSMDTECDAELDIDLDIQDLERRKRGSSRTVKKATNRAILNSIIESVAKDDVVSEKLLKMEDKKFLARFRETIMYIKYGSRINTDGALEGDRTFRLDEIEHALRLCPLIDVDWEEAREKMNQNRSLKDIYQALREAKSGCEVLNAIGAKVSARCTPQALVEKRAKQLKKRLEKIVEFSNLNQAVENPAKRMKMTVEDGTMLNKQDIAKSARDRILNKLKKKQQLTVSPQDATTSQVQPAPQEFPQSDCGIFDDLLDFDDDDVDQLNKKWESNETAKDTDNTVDQCPFNNETPNFDVNDDDDPFSFNNSGNLDSNDFVLDNFGF